VRASALDAAGRAAEGTPSAAVVLAAATAAQADPDASVRRAAFLVISLLASDPGLHGSALRRLVVDADAGNRALALRLAWRYREFDGDAARGVFHAAFAHPDKAVREQAAQVMFLSVNFFPVDDALLRLVADPEPEIAGATILVLAEHWGVRAPPELRRAIAARAADPDERVCAAAGQALRSMTGP
jgi:hypothetical protein